MAIRIKWLTNHYTYYNDYLFSEMVRIQKRQLEVHYKALVLESHPWTNDIDSSYTYRIFKDKPLGFDTQLVKMALTSRDYFVVAGWDCLTYILVISILAIRNRSFAVFTDTPRTPEKSIIQSLKTRWLKWVFRRNARTNLLVTGNIGVKMAESTLGIPPERIINFPFATNNDFFKPQVSATESKIGKRNYLSVGRIVFSHKGQDIALRAFKGLLDKGYTDFSYKVAGLGEDLAKFEALVRELQLEEHVELLGWREVKELPDLFNRSYFTVHSSHEDPFPNSILESLSCGIPVISSDLAGSGLDRIVSGVNGYLHHDNNVQELCALLETSYLLSDEDYHKMREAARLKALEWQVDYNLNVMQEMLAFSESAKDKII